MKNKILDFLTYFFVTIFIITFIYFSIKYICIGIAVFVATLVS
jgi:hypothetical protein